eukprot:1385177-Amorphochlora_amoeboformis.AAC.1
MKTFEVELPVEAEAAHIQGGLKGLFLFLNLKVNNDEVTRRINSKSENLYCHCRFGGKEEQASIPAIIPRHLWKC